ncbi:MAG: hypothetical protein ACFFE2_02920 [Candidatus Thorarchaeota archaeon]
MIASERTQNVIISVTIIAALLSSVFLVSNAVYFGGSYALAGGLEVTIQETTVSNVDPTNETVYPHLSFTFNFFSDTDIEGNVRIMFMGAQITLNDDLLSYTSFAYTLPESLQPLFPNYNRNFTLAKTTGATWDRDTVNLAYNSDTWHWQIVFRFRFITFDEPNTITWRYINFDYTGNTTIRLA